MINNKYWEEIEETRVDQNNRTINGKYHVSCLIKYKNCLMMRMEILSDSRQSMCELLTKKKESSSIHNNSINGWYKYYIFEKYLFSNSLYLLQAQAHISRKEATAATLILNVPGARDFFSSVAVVVIFMLLWMACESLNHLTRVLLIVFCLFLSHSILDVSYCWQFSFVS